MDNSWSLVSPGSPGIYSLSRCSTVRKSVTVERTERKTGRQRDWVIRRKEQMKIFKYTNLTRVGLFGPISEVEFQKLELVYPVQKKS